MEMLVRYHPELPVEYTYAFEVNEGLKYEIERFIEDLIEQVYKPIYDAFTAFADKFARIDLIETLKLKNVEFSREGFSYFMYIKFNVVLLNTTRRTSSHTSLCNPSFFGGLG